MRRCHRMAMVLIVVVGFCLLPIAASAKEDPQSHPPTAPLSLGEAIALGIIEGATEYLPVSSTGHLLIFQHWMGKSTDANETEAAQTLAICIQIGAILAVVFLYFRRLQQMLRGIFGGDPEGRRLAVHLVIAFLPAAVIGLLFHRVIKEHLFGIRSVTVALIVGALLILASPRPKGDDASVPGKELKDLKWWEALVIGALQCLAFWPGFSRSLATILGCRAVGLRMSAAVEFSFLLGLITLTAATAKEGLDHGSKMIEYYGVTSPVVALIVAFVAAVISVHFMVRMLSRYGLEPFGWYRLLLAALCLTLW